MRFCGGSATLEGTQHWASTLLGLFEAGPQKAGPRFDGVCGWSILNGVCGVFYVFRFFCRELVFYIIADRVNVLRLSPPATDTQRGLRSERGTPRFRAHALPSDPCKTMHDNESRQANVPETDPRNTRITRSEVPIFLWKYGLIDDY